MSYWTNDIFGVCKKWNYWSNSGTPTTASHFMGIFTSPSIAKTSKHDYAVELFYIRRYRWPSARMPYSQCVRNADTWDLHQTFGIFRTNWYMIKNKKKDISWIEFIFLHVMNWSPSEMSATFQQFGTSSMVQNNVKRLWTFLTGIVLS